MLRRVCDVSVSVCEPASPSATGPDGSNSDDPGVHRFVVVMFDTSSCFCLLVLLDLPARRRIDSLLVLTSNYSLSYQTFPYHQPKCMLTCPVRSDHCRLAES